RRRFPTCECLTPSCRRPTKRSYADARKEKAPEIDVARTRRRRARTRRFAACPLWVRSGHLQGKKVCPHYPQKRTCAVQLGMSALDQKRTLLGPNTKRQNAELSASHVRFAAGHLHRHFCGHSRIMVPTVGKSWGDTVSSAP